jgi:hypothetical protein
MRRMSLYKRLLSSPYQPVTENPGRHSYGFYGRPKTGSITISKREVLSNFD